MPDMGGVEGVYSDFLLHRARRPRHGRRYGGYGPELPPDVAAAGRDHPQPDEWKTPPLWGVADSAPYLHDGRPRRLETPILRHRSDARGVRNAYKKLSQPDQDALLAFLGTLPAAGRGAGGRDDILGVYKQT